MYFKITNSDMGISRDCDTWGKYIQKLGTLFLVGSVFPLVCLFGSVLGKWCTTENQLSDR